MTDPKKLPPKTITFKVGENEYTVPYPKTGQMLEIEAMKIALSRNQYNSFAAGDTVSILTAKVTTDMIAFFSVCCQQLRKDLNVEMFSELEQWDNKKLLALYIKTIMPWLDEWQVFLNTDDEPVVTTETVTT
jgi:hypothetical protein